MQKVNSYDKVVKEFNSRCGEIRYWERSLDKTIFHHGITFCDCDPPHSLHTRSYHIRNIPSFIDCSLLFRRSFLKRNL